MAAFAVVPHGSDWRPSPNVGAAPSAAASVRLETEPSSWASGAEIVRLEVHHQEHIGEGV